MKKALLAALPAVLLSGCFFRKAIDDRPWNEESVAKIEVGKSTKADVLRLLGPPKQIVRLLESEAYMYTHTVEKHTGTFLVVVNLYRTDRQYDSVCVVIDRKDVVTAVGSRFKADKAKYGVPWRE